jgi:short-subunit dehydrogenase
VRTLVCDLADARATTTLRTVCAGLEVGLVVYNAALSPIGPFFEQQAGTFTAAISTNCTTQLHLVHAFGADMRSRRRGGIVMMGSLSGMQGTSMLATYAATKAFTLVLAEGIAEECRGSGVDVLACVAGATLTPGYLASKSPGTPKPPGELSPEAVVRKALAALGRRTLVIPGAMNSFSAFVLTRLLPRRLAVAIISRNTEAMFRRPA